MSRKTKRVCFSPHVNDDKSTIFAKPGSGGCGSSKISSPLSFLRRLGEKLAEKALKVISMRRRRSSGKVSSSTLVRSRSLSSDPTADSHRAEAVEDCIEFLHSSSCRERPSS